jgi:molybdopterin synthase sulfur carrier subunit
MKIRVLFFASLRERLHMSEADHDLKDGSTVAELWADLCDRSPGLRDMAASISFAVNQEYVDRATVLHDGDEVALIPPVSGG